MGRDEIRDADALADSSLCGWAFHPPCLIRIHPPMSRCNCLLYKRSQWCHSGRRNRWNVSNAPLDSDFYPSPECWRNSGTGPIARIGSSSVSRASQFYNNASTDDSIRSRANVNSTSQFNRAISRCLIASRRTWIAGAIISTAPTLVPSTGKPVRLHLGRDVSLLMAATRGRRHGSPHRTSWTPFDHGPCPLLFHTYL